MATASESEKTVDHVRAEILSKVRALYEGGLYLQAYQVSREAGPLEGWRSTADALLAARLAAQLAAPTLANWLIRRAWRSDPSDPEARFYNAFRIFRLHGPYRAWRWTAQAGDPGPSTPGEIRSRWHALRGSAAGALRDFTVGESLIDQAIQLAPDSSYAQLCRASLLEYEDRYTDALVVVQQVIQTDPTYVQAVELASHLLTLLGRDREAMELLAEASERFESGALQASLHVFQMELKQYDRARESLDRWVSLSPLAEKGAKKWLESRRSELAYHLGDYPAAIRHAEASDDEFFKTIAQRLAEPARQRAGRVELPVGFVKQHRMTCVPATLSAISRFWSKAADHVQVADEICYNGTSAYNERQWACRNGWLAREFTVTEESAQALLDRGVPFTFTTVEPGSSHLQAVIGYDGRRGTLLIRDPSVRVSGEALADKILYRYRAFGPRGMAMAPKEESARFEGLALPDADLWDQLHAFDGALESHCRDEAQRILKDLSTKAPDHRITRDARMRLACYDANTSERLEAVESLLQIASDDPCLQLERLGCLRGFSQRAQRLAVIEEICSARHPHPIFLQQCAEELRADASRLPEAAMLARRALRKSPMDGGNYFVLAGIYWDQRRFAEALELYRFAACLKDTEESFAQSYFIAAQWFKKTDESLQFLQARFERFGAKSWMPARTLVTALLDLNRSGEAIVVAEKAITIRPDDAELALFVAKIYSSFGGPHFARALSLLSTVEPKAPRGQWLRVAAQMAEMEGRCGQALDLWRELLQTSPLAVDAHAAVATLLAEQQGKTAGLAYLEKAVAKFPHYQPLYRLWAQRLHDEPATVREPVFRRILAANPDDAWMHREVGFLLVNERRFAEAWEEAELSLRLEPHEAPTYHLRALLFRCEGRIAEAKDALRATLAQSIDNSYAAHELLDLCSSLAERRRALNFIRDELKRQVTFGDGLLTFRELAHGTLDAAELLAVLQEAVQSRPDLWHAWSAVVQQLMNMNRLSEAWEVVNKATARYPLLPRLWLDQAAVARARGDDAAECQALEMAYRINPKWSLAVRALCGFHERHGNPKASRELLEQLVTFAPLDAANQVMLAETLWRQGEQEAALERVRRVAGFEPGYNRVWECLNHWSSELKRRDVALEAARAVIQQRGGEARSWLIAARAHSLPEELESRLQALDKALSLNPECVEAFDLRARSLAAAGRWEDAYAACRPPVFGENVPVDLRARGAWIAAEQGDVRRAIEEMQRVVAESPAKFDAWTSLHQWCVEIKDAKGSLAAAESMVRIAPQYEYSYGCLGQARTICHDRDGAIEAYRRAMEINPGYEFAGVYLFDLYLEGDDLRSAAATLATVQEHVRSAYVLARVVQLAVRQRNFKAACEALAQVCVTECSSPWPVNAAVDAMVKAGRNNDAFTILRKAIDREGVHAEVACRWARWCAAKGDWAFERWIRSLGKERVWPDKAACDFLDSLAKARKWWQFRSFVAANRRYLRATTFTWGSVGYGMAVLHLYRQAAAWMADWSDRTDAESWMLVNAAEGFLNIGDSAEAAAICGHALSLKESQPHVLHRILLTAIALLRTDIPAVRANMVGVDTKKYLDADYSFLVTVAQCVLDMESAETAKRADVYREASNRMDRAARVYAGFLREPARRRLYRHCRRHIALRRGGIAAWWWHLSWWGTYCIQLRRQLG
jgi:tetratricopeptide (TPR) repeat protein